MDTPIYTHKLVILGESCVGKSSIVLRHTKNKFNDDESSTIGASFLTSKIKLDNYSIKFEIWDTAGQERYHSLAPLYYRNASVIFVIFDITSYISYAQAKNWVKELKHLGPEQAYIVLVGNKYDMKHLKKINSEDVNHYARENNITYIETSAKINYNIENLFKDAALHVPKKDANTGMIKLDGNNLFNDKQYQRSSALYCCV